MSDDNSTPADLASHRRKRQKLMEPEASQSSQSFSEVKVAASDEDVPTDEDVYYEQTDRDINADPIMKLYPHDFRAELCDSLLLTIVNHSAGRCDFTTAEMKSLFEEKKELKQMLLTAWKSKSYKDILRLLIEYHQHRTSATSPAQPSELELFPRIRANFYTGYMQQVVEDAWSTPYQGSHHELLFQNLNKMAGSEPYRNICAVVQSSGTGKSRMVDEQAKLVFTLPMNIRDKVGTYVTYPPSDESLHTYFVAMPNSPDACKRRYLVFFSSLFSHAAEELSQLVNRSQQSQENLAKTWREYMNNRTSRQDFYSSVVRSCTSAATEKDCDVLEKDAQSCLTHLINALDQRCKSTSKIKVVLYIDEAHELDNLYQSDKEHRTQLNILCSVLAEFYRKPLFCLLLSTQPLLHFLVPPGQAATSEHARLIARELLASITETPFDCAPDIKISPGVLRLENLVDIDYLAKWGRPLWWTMIKKDKPGQGRPTLDHEMLIDLARVKLLRHHDINARFIEVSQAQLTAVLDVLLMFDFGPSREKTRRKQDEIVMNEAQMVANHMRIAYSVPQHREYLISGYPSEPLLAEAAAQQIHQYQSQVENRDRDVMVRILASTVERSWTDLGECGEVVMRLLLMRAYMDGVLAERRSSEVPLIFSRGCNLITFIEQLFSSGPASDILDSKPDNIIMDTTFRDAFKNSVVRFTHFAKAGDESVLTTEALFAAFARGMAFICQQGQEYVDFAIPILLDKSDTLQESAMSAILVQVKRRRKAHGGAAYAFRQEDVGLFPAVGDEKSTSRPYFVLIAELCRVKQEADGETQKADDGEQKRGRGRHKGKEKEKARESSTSSEIYISQQSEVQHHSTETHPRFLATPCGCSSMYKAARKKFAGYQHLLVIRDFLEEHPRQDAESRSAVMRLKPLWKYGKDSYHWVESEMFNKGAPTTDD